MGEEIFSLLADLDSGRAGGNSSQYSILQPHFKKSTQLVPQRDCYRALRPGPAYDLVGDDGPYVQDPALDSFDEKPLQQTYRNRHRQPTDGQGRLSFAPETLKKFASNESSQPQPSSFCLHDGSATFAGHQQDNNSYPRQLVRRGLTSYAYTATQPQEYSSDAQLGNSSSPAFKAGQRRAVNNFRDPAQSFEPHRTPGVSSAVCGRRERQVSRSEDQQTSGAQSTAGTVYNAHVPVIQGIPLVPITALPDRLRAIFPFPAFNAVQSRCFENVYKSDDNFVLASPTGSGKTAILELAICRAVITETSGQYKIVYQAPTKALCSERQRDWQKKFSQIGLNCVELTGDSEASDLRNVQSANIIVATPEKWDSITRKWKDHEKLMRLVKLFLIDEVHILKEDRGAILEAVVSRTKSLGTDVRFVALSATVPNFDDVATWLGKSSAERYEPAISLRFGEEFRPVRLRKHVCGYPSTSNNDFAFEKRLDAQLPEVIKRFSERKPIMVFCFTRNSTVSTAKSLGNWWATRNPKDRMWDPPSKTIPFQNRELRDCAASGVAFHHAGLAANDRLGVETAFLKGELGVICCTSTLAVGVNLPCHFVIIKNTVTFTQQGIQEYSDLEIIQMLGRAGRPQFEDSAVAVIMTRQHKVSKYEKMVSGQETLESTLHTNLIDHLNAEIGLGTIRDPQSARKWLSGTFLYVRLKQNPLYYKLGDTRNSQDIDKLLDDICFRDITLLRENNLITDSEQYCCTDFGHAMARYYVHFDTMRIFMGLQPKASLSELLSATAQASEFRDVRFRSGEKSLYNTINKSPYIRFPVPVNLDLPAHKVSLLIQSILGAADIPWDGEYSKHKVQYNTDAVTIFKHISRQVRCIIDCQICVGDSVSTLNALILERSLSARVWDDSPLQMKQIQGLGVVAVRKLASAGIRTIEELQCTDAQKIDVILGKNPPFGLNVLEQLKRFPKLRVSLHVPPNAVMKTTEGVTVQVKADIGFINENPPVVFGSKAVYVCVLAETSDGRKVHFARISGKKLGKGQSVTFPALLSRPDLSIICYIMCDGIAGTTRSATVKPNFSASMFPAPRPPPSAMPNSPERPTSNMARRRADTAGARKQLAGEDEFGDNEIGDEELVEAAFRDLDFDHIDNYANPTDSITRKNTAKNTSTKGKDRKKLARSEEEDVEPKQLQNGRWACNHKCKDKSACKHICCREGLEKPSKKTTTKRTAWSESRSQASSHELAREKGKMPTILQISSSKRKALEAIEELDLTHQEKRKRANQVAKGSKDCRELHRLHYSIQKLGTPSSISSVMHQKPAYCYSKGGDHRLSFLENDPTAERSASIYSDYDDVQFDDLDVELERPIVEDVSAGVREMQKSVAIDDVMGSPIESETLDRLSDTFDDNDSIFGDALQGLIDSEQFREADKNGDDVLQIQQEAAPMIFDDDIRDDEFPADGMDIVSYDDEPHTEPLDMSTSSVVVPYVPGEKARSLFCNDTSTPRPGDEGLKATASVLDRVGTDGSERPEEASVTADGASNAGDGDALMQSAAEKIMERSPRAVEVEKDAVAEAFKDLEPWLFQEFGDIVELVD